MSFVQNINGKFEKITEASWYKILMPQIIWMGAAIVILGALFKIENSGWCKYNVNDRFRFRIYYYFLFLSL